jgi:hypothetical protein
LLRRDRFDLPAGQRRWHFSGGTTSARWIFSDGSRRHDIHRQHETRRCNRSAHRHNAGGDSTRSAVTSASGERRALGRDSRRARWPRLPPSPGGGISNPAIYQAPKFARANPSSSWPSGSPAEDHGFTNRRRVDRLNRDCGST